MHRWRDEDDYLTYLSRMWDRLTEPGDCPPTEEELIHDMLQRDWVDLFCESISENDNPWFERALRSYEDGDHLALGAMIADTVTEYARAVAIVRGIIDE